MKRVYTAESVVQVAHIRNMLAAEGIRSEMRNERLGSVIGEIPSSRPGPNCGWPSSTSTGHRN